MRIMQARPTALPAQRSKLEICMCSWTWVICHAGSGHCECWCSSCALAKHSLRASLQACKHMLSGVCVAGGIAVTPGRHIGCSD
jgi:hypothetical protein